MDHYPRMKKQDLNHEYKILDNILTFMEEKGLNYKVVVITIDQDLTDEINAKHKTKISLEDLQRAAAKCLAHEWLEPSYIGSGQFEALQITPKGIGAAKSKKKSNETKSSRGILKKISDFIEDHKGLFILLGFLIAAATFATKFMGIKQ